MLPTQYLKEKSPGAVAKVFAGVAVGLVLGVPMSSLIAEHLSLSSAFYFGAVSCVLAFIGIIFFVPSFPSTKKLFFEPISSVKEKGTLVPMIFT
ncbi:hypothetical protein [Xenorhabdus thailandensis]|uniref:hypothetical protein n=1 Tax=Xenorhabdus thailandensis TaxID=3136255 RepID=UPI0030F3E894